MTTWAKEVKGNFRYSAHTSRYFVLFFYVRFLFKFYTRPITMYMYMIHIIWYFFFLLKTSTSMVWYNKKWFAFAIQIIIIIIICLNIRKKLFSFIFKVFAVHNNNIILCWNAFEFLPKIWWWWIMNVKNKLQARHLYTTI